MRQFEKHQELTITKVRRLLKYMTELINRRMITDRLPITYEQFPLLMITIYCEGSSMQEMARVANQDKAGILRGLRALELRGLIEFKDDATDLRKRLVFPTEKAKRLSTHVIQRVKAFENSIIRDIQEKEMKVFLSVLGRLSDTCLELGATKLPRLGLDKK